MTENKIQFIRGKRLADYAKERVAVWSKRPFGRPQSSNNFLERLTKNFFLSLEVLMGGEIYVKSSLSPWDNIPARFQRILRELARKGVIEKIFFPQPIAGWPHIPAFSILSSNEVHASGYALDPEIAATKAVAELIEWHTLATPDYQRFVTGSFEKLGHNKAIDPRLFNHFSSAQLERPEYAPHRIKSDSTFRWVKSVSLEGNGIYLVPAQLAHIKYDFLSEEPRIRQTISNGGAAGISWDGAAYHALCEVIERDALMVHWLNQISPPQVELTALRKLGHLEINALLNLYEKYAINVSLLDITTDLRVPVFMAVIRPHAPGLPRLYLSPRCDLDKEKALVAALTDGFRAGFLSTTTVEEIKRVEQKAPAIENLNERRIYWCDERRDRDAEFMFLGQTEILERNGHEGKDDAAKLKELKKILTNYGLSAYITDITGSLASQAGLRVVMALVAGLYPLYLNEHFKCLGSQRLHEAPIKMGIFQRPKKEEEFNVIPHPFL
ncbi:MAG: YcaO-like family protein [Candidatus Sungbacteria bacterium]|nr:YcaO-like family protein [Candidatus Sungbacteria bacterium]